MIRNYNARQPISKMTGEAYNQQHNNILHITGQRHDQETNNLSDLAMVRIYYRDMVATQKGRHE